MGRQWNAVTQNKGGGREVLHSVTSTLFPAHHQSTFHSYHSMLAPGCLCPAACPLIPLFFDTHLGEETVQGSRADLEEPEDPLGQQEPQAGD